MPTVCSLARRVAAPGDDRGRDHHDDTAADHNVACAGRALAVVLLAFMGARVVRGHSARGAVAVSARTTVIARYVECGAGGLGGLSQ